jgi:mycothiol system anti-sigma-R factor
MSEHCQDALDRLYAYLDRELDVEAVTAIRVHLGDCPPCGGAFAFEERLLITIRSGLREEIPPVLIDRLRAALRPPST